MSYGSDIWAAEQLVTSRRTQGSETVLLAIFRRITTPQGTLVGGDEEDAYGFDLASYVGTVGYDTAIEAIPTVVRAEILKDERVSDVVVTVTSSSNSGGVINIQLTIDAVLVDEEDEFALQIGVSDVTVELLGGVEL